MDWACFMAGEFSRGMVPGERFTGAILLLSWGLGRSWISHSVREGTTAVFCFTGDSKLQKQGLFAPRKTRSRRVYPSKANIISTWTMPRCIAIPVYFGVECIYP